MSHYKRPGVTVGMRHLALNVSKFDESLDFYTSLLGMAVKWQQPGQDNYYLTSGNDNLALHRAKNVVDRSVGRCGAQSFDHLGFIIDKAKDVPR